MMKTRWAVVAAAGLVALAACGDSATNGAAAPPRVLARVDAASTAECPFGGSVVRSGTDRNGDGVLDDAEIEQQTPVCDDASAPPIVLRLIAEPAGAHCATGGTAVKSGPDRNGNGVLDDDEITRIDYLCGEALLSRLRDAAPGAGCAAGGVAIQVGRDRDGDGVLGDDEVEQTDLQCGTVLTGDVAVRSADDAAALARIVEIDGALTLDASGLDELALPALTLVHGGIAIRNEPALTRVALPSLQAIDGAFALTDDAQLARLELPALTRAGSLTIDHDPALPDLAGAPKLVDVVGDVQITHNAALTTAVLPYHGGAGRLTIDDNAQLAQITLAIQRRLGPAHIADNPALRGVSIEPAFDAFFGVDLDAWTIERNAQLAGIVIRGNSIGAVAIADNPALSTVSLWTGAAIGGLTMAGNGPASVSMTTLVGAGLELGVLSLSGPITAVHTDRAVRVHGDCVLAGTQIVSFEPDGPDNFDVACTGALVVTDNAKLTRLPRFLTSRGVEVRRNAALASLEVQCPALTGDLAITDNPVLHDVSAVTDQVGGDLTITGNPALEIVVQNIQRVAGALVLAGDDQLRDPGLAQLFSVGSLAVSACGALTTLDLPALGHVATRVDVRGNAALRDLGLPALHAADMGVFDNPHLAACAVDAVFARLTGDHQQSGNDSTAECVP
ncbi:MAG TPA: hypothetical protein VFP84_18040 [Kofleriaceae bacterium]|nr:hypothetical protein [Kofleriaceae bacterium]